MTFQYDQEGNQIRPEAGIKFITLVDIGLWT